jgi:hypothetical protein
MLPRLHLAAAFAATGLGLASAASPAHAQGANEAAATALFDEGRKLMAERRWSDACPKLAESQRLAPSGGTLLNLADCYEHTGQTASAWAAWKDVAARANAAGKGDVEKRAVGRAAALEPSLAKLTIAVDAGSDVAGLDVKRDGVAVGHAEFGAAIPVDPGPHVVEATAPKKKAFTARVDVAPKQTDARVTVALEDEPQQVAPAPGPGSGAVPGPGAHAQPGPEQPASAGGSPLRTVGIVVGAAGLGGVVVGSVFGLVAKSKNDQALQPQNCRTPTLCTQTGLSLTSDAKSAATVSTVAFAAGGVLVATGAVLWLVAPSSSEPRTGVRVAPLLAQSYGGLAVDGTW